jgi:hypothetical protein
MTEKAVKEPKMTSTPTGNAFKRKDWETLTVTFVLAVSFLATLWMMLISLQGEAYRIIPAAFLLALVQIWLIVYIPVYGKLAFWGAIIFVATYLFFAVPFVVLGILPPEFNFYALVFIVVSLICLLLLFRRRALFLNKPVAKSSKSRH